MWPKKEEVQREEHTTISVVSVVSVVSVGVGPSRATCLRLERGSGATGALTGAGFGDATHTLVTPATRAVTAVMSTEEGRG